MQLNCHANALALWGLLSARSKTARIMRWTLILVTAFSLHASAGSYGQSVTFSGEKVTLEKVFSVIKEQTGYVVFYDYNLLNSAAPVTVNARSQPLSEFLENVLKDQPLKYLIRNRTIVISRKQLFFHPPVRITATILDENGRPLRGATIRIKGGQTGVATDTYGRFTLEVNEGDALEISFIGYMEATFRVKNGTLAPAPELSNGADGLSIRLVSAQTALQEVVINKGYYTTSKVLNTGSVSAVSGKTISEQPVSNPMLALQGRMTGVYITQQTGVPGGAISIQIRGRNSLRYDGNEPLYIVDGVPFSGTNQGTPFSGLMTRNGSPFTAFNPNDIESIEVLKDADATAIYGSRGANGVVLITTKKGKAGASVVNVRFSQGFAKVPKFLDLLDTKQYLSMRHEAFANDGMEPGDVSSDVDLLMWDTTRNTDWQKEFIGGTASYTDANASISGGTAAFQYLLGTGYHRETTVFPGNFADEKYSVNLNINHRSKNERLNVVVSGSYVLDNNQLFYRDLTGDALYLPPVAPAPFNEDGSLNWANGSWNNPLAPTQQRLNARTGNMTGNLNLQYRILKSLYFRATAGYNEMNYDERSTTPSTSINPAYNPSGTASFGNRRIRTWITEPQLEFQQNIGKGKLSILAGASVQRTNKDYLLLWASGFTSDALLTNLQAAPSLQVQASEASVYKYASVFGRINYNFKERYLLNITGRRDGSSRFGPGRQFANFGAVGAGWVFSAEEWMTGVKHILSYGKLRASYGSSGNDQIGDYKYLDLWNTTQYYYSGSMGIYPLNLYNPDYAWEVNRKAEATLELGWLKDRINVAVSYYRNRSSNQLLEYGLPFTTGFYALQTNLPATVQNTGMEVELNTTNIRNSKLQWSTGFNITIPRNKLISYPDLENSSYGYQYTIGKSLNARRSMQFTGVDPQTGIFTTFDKDGDGSYYDAPEDFVTSSEIGQQLFGGLSNSFTYGNWSMEIFFQFVKQTNYHYMIDLFGSYPGTAANQPVRILDRWQKPGDITDVPKFSQDYGDAYNAHASARYYSNFQATEASFIRLKNVYVQYQLPQRWRDRLQIERANIFLQGQNLLTFTRYFAMDPESSATSLPPLRTITAGIQLTL